MTKNTKNLVLIAVFCALAYVVDMLIHFPLILSYLEYDPKDVMIAIAGIALGPTTAILLSVLVPLLEFFTRSTSGIIGLAMNVIGALAFCLPITIVYKKSKTFKGVIIGGLISVLSLAIIMLLWNYILTPIYMGIPREEVVPLLASAIIPFNLVKGSINTVLIILLYKPLVLALKKARLIEIEK